jgi:hypothetical protein
MFRWSKLARGVLIASAMLMPVVAESRPHHRSHPTSSPAYGDDYERAGYGYPPDGDDRRPQRRERRDYRQCDRGTTGTLLGAIAGGLLGNVAVGRHGNGTAGTLLGAGAGALVGNAAGRDC